MTSPASLPVIQRQCGPCTLCCTVMAVKELYKPTHQKCTHSFENGCRIYDSRPESCRTFHCSWIRGDDEPSDRPDMTGIFFWRQFNAPLGGMLLICEEARPGALNQPRAKKLLEARSQVELVVIRPANSATVLQMIGPPHELARIVPLLKASGQWLGEHAAERK